MNKLTIVSNKKKLEIIIDRIKFIIGNDEEIKYLLLNTINNYFNKLSDSEYAEENALSSYLLYNDEKLNIKDFEYFYVHPLFDLDLDIKLNSKSLSLMYVNSLLDNIEYNETYQTICMLLEDLYNELEIEEDNIVPLIDFKLSVKELIKLISMSFLKNDDKINNYDLSLEEKIMLQLNMIKCISKKCNKNFIIYVKIPFLSTKIYNIIKSIDALTLIDFNFTNIYDIDDIILINNDLIVDINNDNEIYELCNNHYNHITIKEMKEYIIDNHLKKLILK